MEWVRKILQKCSSTASDANKAPGFLDDQGSSFFLDPVCYSCGWTGSPDELIYQPQGSYACMVGCCPHCLESGKLIVAETGADLCA